MRLIKINATNSTNSFLKELAQNSSLEEYTIAVANTQTSGRGQMNNSWTSEPYKNLTFSIFTHLKKLKIKDQAYLNFAISLAIYDTLLTYNIPKLCIKWPNDIMSAKKKICGILIETTFSHLKIKNTIIGIGLNLNLPNKESWWGDLSSFNLELKRNELINIIIIELINFIDNDIHQWVDEWEGLCIHMNSEINIKQNNKIIDSGIFTGINQDGSVKITSKDGNIKKYEFGEISIDGVY